ncbi:MAG: FAD-dependent oxidoreductase, partial [Planctomycetales bacterium]|nr:FAD-dependent oxidoreductase [Planctomycetales bacterium]
MDRPHRIAVLGGGITGLSAAYQLNQSLPAADVVLYEAAARLGGIIRTEQADGYLVEHAADNFLRGP